MADFDENMKIKHTSYTIEKAICTECNAISTGKLPTIEGTSLGPTALWVMLEYNVNRSPDSVNARYFKRIHKFGISPNTVLNARKALANHFGPAYESILSRISQSPFVNMDESWCKTGGKKKDGSGWHQRKRQHTLLGQRVGRLI